MMQLYSSFIKTKIWMLCKKSMHTILLGASAEDLTGWAKMLKTAIRQSMPKATETPSAKFRITISVK